MEESRRVQYLAAFAVSLASMTTSMGIAWTVPILPMFHNNQTNITITENEISWMVSMISPGLFVGCLISSVLSDKYGRRTTLLASPASFIVGTIFVLFATKPWMLFVARFLWGCGSGMIGIVSSVYISEIADKDIRGSLTAGTRFLFSFGALLMLTVGSFVTYQTLSSFLLVLPVMYFIACWMMPETPYFLLKEGKVDAARKEIIRLSGCKNEKTIEEKLSLMRSDVRREMLRSGTLKELFTGPQYRRAIIISTGLRITQVMAGSIPIQQYLGRIVQESHSGMELATALISFGAIQFIVGLISPMFIDKVGRRPLLIASYLGSCLMLGIVGTYFFYQKFIGITNESTNPLRFTVFICVNISIIISSVGYDVLVFVIPAEIFPLNVKSIAITTLNISNAFITFVAVKGYQPMEEYIGFYGIFWFYASMALAGAVFSYFYIPETKGKSLSEIQVLLQGDAYDEAGVKLAADIPLEEINSLKKC